MKRKGNPNPCYGKDGHCIVVAGLWPSHSDIADPTFDEPVHLHIYPTSEAESMKGMLSIAFRLTKESE